MAEIPRKLKKGMCTSCHFVITQRGELLHPKMSYFSAEQTNASPWIYFFSKYQHACFNVTARQSQSALFAPKQCAGTMTQLHTSDCLYDSWQCRARKLYSVQKDLIPLFNFPGNTDCFVVFVNVNHS